MKTKIEQLHAHKDMKRNLSVPGLVEEILERDEGILTATGAVRSTTGKYTGRSPKDKFIVRDSETDHKVDW